MSRHSADATTERVTAGSSESCAVLLRRASDIEMRPVSWLWEGWLAAGKLHMLGGVAGTGKTTIALSLAAVVTAGGRWPDGTPTRKRGNVVIWSGEDSAEDTLVPRLAAAGADLSCVRIVGAVAHGAVRRPFDPALDIDALIAAARAIGDVLLFVVDPVVMAVTGDSHKNAEVRRGLAPLTAFAEELGAAVLGITHFSKGTTEKDPLERLTGSLAFGAAPRLVFAAAKKRGDDGTEGRLLVRLKSNLGPDGGGINYQLESSQLQTGLLASRIMWGEPVEGSVHELLSDSKITDDVGRRSARAEAESFLRCELAGGPVGVHDIERHANKEGIAWATVRRAKQALGVTSQHDGFGPDSEWLWALPSVCDVPKGAQEHQRRSPILISTNEQDEHL